MTSVPSPAGSPARLILPANLRDQILVHLLDAAPNEGVGLLATRAAVAPGEDVVAARFYPGRNKDASPTRFAMDEGDVLTAIRDIRERGDALGAIVHSHIYGPPTPSRIDLDEAYYPEALMVIVSFATQPSQMRAWHIGQRGDQKIVSDVPIVVTTGNGPA